MWKFIKQLFCKHPWKSCYSYPMWDEQVDGEWYTVTAKHCQDCGREWELRGPGKYGND